MERRKFLASSLAASALAVTTTGSYAEAAQGAMQGKGREFYQLRRYHLNSGPQRKLCDDFFRDALMPALNRLAISPVGGITGHGGDSPRPGRRIRESWRGFFECSRQRACVRPDGEFISAGV